MKRTGNAHWSGNLKEGKGNLSTQSTVLNQTQYSFKTRFEDGIGTNPEELIAAAHAGCFTMAITAVLSQEGISADSIDTVATLEMDPVGLAIKGVHLETKATIAGLDNDKFQAIAEGAKANCLVSKILNIPITLSATLS